MEPEITMQDKGSKCYECPYRQSERYCFPCMKKLLGYEEKKTENETMLEQGEKTDG